jgi:ATP-binding protein involved in chromosome partitioning
MFEKVQVPVLGIVENMATHVCSNCGHVEAIFGSGGGQRMAEEYGVELLGSLPLDLRIREQADSGTPSVAAEPQGAAAREYLAIARRVGARVAQRARDYSARFPSIKVVET